VQVWTNVAAKIGEARYGMSTLRTGARSVVRLTSPTLVDS